MDKEQTIKLSRRALLVGGMLLGTGMVIPVPGFCRSERQTAAERTVHLQNIHTGEVLETVYWAEGRYLPEALGELDWLLRDHRTDQVKPIDPALFDLVSDLRSQLCPCGPVQIISGYRSPQTNQLLRTRSTGVAKNSLHMQGMALDIRMPGCELDELRRAAVASRVGGVGFYPKSQFVHVDTGRVRAW